MKLFLLIHEQDTDAAWGSSVDLFSTLEAAQAEMRKIYEKTIESWNFDIENQTDDSCCEFSDMNASIRDGSMVCVLFAAQPQSEKHIWMRWRRLSSWKRWRRG